MGIIALYAKRELQSISRYNLISIHALPILSVKAGKRQGDKPCLSLFYCESHSVNFLFVYVPVVTASVIPRGVGVQLRLRIS